MALYAAVVLAPKAWVWLNLSAAYRTNVEQLTALQQRIKFLEQVAEALQTDPEFAAEFARLDLAARSPEEERIAVEGHLAWDTRRAEMLPEVPPPSLPWYAPLVRLIAFSRSVRTVILLAAAGVMLLSFTFLHESQAARVELARAAIRTGFRSLRRRYQKAPPADESLSSGRSSRG
ncbi:MAG TPA: hypothetical protein EYP14_20475 [Planctomycetaceae bacterium]|nr:hypothetical protein [Planctomycetaceae bacterium]